MRELGRILREKRESVGLDLDALHAQTKIRKRYLMALEEGDWTVLPGDVYARGFVRSYAEALGLDGLQLLHDHVDGHAQQTEANMQAPSSQNSPETILGTSILEPSKTTKASAKSESLKRPMPKTRSPQTKLLSSRKLGGVSQVAVVAAALVVIAGVWIALRHPNAAPPTTALNNNVTNSTTQISPTTTNSTSSSGTANNTSNSTGRADGSTAQISPGPFQNFQEVYTVSTTQPLTINLTSMNGDCWIKVTVDGTVVDPNDTITGGQTKSWTAKQNVAIRLGHVSGMQLQINGQPVVLPTTQNAIDVIINKSTS